jgi:uncharacterized protein YecA (UPF0149 family)
MDTRDGRIVQSDYVAALPEEERRHYKPMALAPTPAQRAVGRVGRNDPCPCMSGKKFKRCCLQRSR